MATQKKSNIANTAVRIFLQEFGAEYDDARGLARYKRKSDLPVYEKFFDHACCFCGVLFGPGNPAVEDHLQAVNQTRLGLHAVGNIVPSCASCNAAKLDKDWREFIQGVAGKNAAARTQRIEEFVASHGYEPDPDNLRAATKDLYAEVGEVAMALIKTKIKRTRESLASEEAQDVDET